MIYTLYETDKLRLEHEYESAALIEKSTGKVLFKDEFYGDPNCGLIDHNNQWAIVAGEHMAIWTPSNSKIFNIKDLKWIHSLRVKDFEIVEVLIDPWADNASVWEINTKTFNVIKIKEFNDYKNKKYSNEIIW